MDATASALSSIFSAGWKKDVASKRLTPVPTLKCPVGPGGTGFAESVIAARVQRRLSMTTRNAAARRGRLC